MLFLVRNPHLRQAKMLDTLRHLRSSEVSVRASPKGREEGGFL